MKRITLFAGHYGSGKTNIAVNFAFDLRKKGLPVIIADLDIVNPYFRTADSRNELQEAGIGLIAPEFANTNLDIPALPKELYRVTAEKDKYVVLDIGGDDSGAVALGRLTPDILKENDFDMLFVENLYRPLTRTAEECLAVMREIEAAGGLPFTGIVNNSNIGWDTTPGDIEAAYKETKRLSELSGLPIAAITAEEKVAGALTGGEIPVFPLRLQSKYFDIKGIEKWQK